MAGADGLGRPALVPFGELPGCPRAAADASGAAVVAGATEDALRVALREPGGGGFGAPVTLAAAENVFELSVAVSPHGDAVVAWAEYAYAPRRVRIRVARRDAGGAFGAPADLVPWRPDTGSVGVLAGMAADGETVVLVREPTGTEQRPASTDAVRTGARGAPLGPATPLPPGIYALALGVAPDGRVVLAATSGGSVYVLERPRGGALGAPQPLTDPQEPVNADQMAVAFGADGRTVVAWHDDDDGTTGAAVRDGATGFGPPVVIVPAPKQPSADRRSAPICPSSAHCRRCRPRSRRTAASRWRGRTATCGSRRWPGTRSSNASDSAAGCATPKGSPCSRCPTAGARSRGRTRTASTRTRPRGCTTRSRASRPRPSPRRRGSRSDGRGRAPCAPAQALVLPVHCSAACDLDVTLAGDGAQGVQRSLTRAGTVTVRLTPPSRAIAPARPGPVRVTVRSSAPGARTATRTIATPRLRRLPALPLPRIEAVRARRLSGGRVEVRWRMSSDARDTLLSVTRHAHPRREPRRRPGLGRPVGPAAPELPRRARGRRGHAVGPRRGRRADR